MAKNDDVITRAHINLFNAYRRVRDKRLEQKLDRDPINFKRFSLALTRLPEFPEIEKKVASSPFTPEKRIRGRR
jgi:hypothetical protein